MSLMEARKEQLKSELLSLADTQAKEVTPPVDPATKPCVKIDDDATTIVAETLAEATKKSR